MMIYVNGQDIARLILGTVQNGAWKHEPEVFEIRPEQYLQGLEEFLRAQKIGKQDIEAFLLVKGPGSATSLRASHAMVNALAFALDIQIVSVEKSPEQDDLDVIAELNTYQPHAFALPVYAYEPNITQTKRDALKRKAS